MGVGHTKVMIASTNSIFRNGIEKILSNRSDFNSLLIYKVTKLEVLIKKFSRTKPNVVIIDFDDKDINKNEFLDSFFHERRDTQLLIVSLQESGNVVLYKKIIFSTEQALAWLNVPWNEDSQLVGITKNYGGS